jgi:hypothetical protein
MLQNDGKQTSVALSDAGQNQRSNFSTGTWAQKPQLWGVGEGFIVQISTDEGEKYLRVENNGIHFLDQKPELSKAEEMELQESEAESEPPMKPMAPMKPMEP